MSIVKIIVVKFTLTWIKSANNRNLRTNKDHWSITNMCVIVFCQQQINNQVTNGWKLFDYYILIRNHINNYTFFKKSLIIYITLLSVLLYCNFFLKCNTILMKNNFVDFDSYITRLFIVFLSDQITTTNWIIFIWFFYYNCLMYILTKWN